MIGMRLGLTEEEQQLFDFIVDSEVMTEIADLMLSVMASAIEGDSLDGPRQALREQLTFAYLRGFRAGREVSQRLSIRQES